MTSVLVATFCLITSPQTPTFPLYKVADGATWTFSIQGTESMVQYTTAGQLSLLFKKGTSKEVAWHVTARQSVHFLQDGRRGPGDTVERRLDFTTDFINVGVGGVGSGGSLRFISQIFYILMTPTKSEQMIQGDKITSRLRETASTYIVTSTIVDQDGGRHEVERVIDKESRELLSGKCESRTQEGKVTYRIERFGD